MKIIGYADTQWAEELCVPCTQRRFDTGDEHLAGFERDANGVIVHESIVPIMDTDELPQGAYCDTCHDTIREPWTNDELVEAGFEPRDGRGKSNSP